MTTQYIVNSRDIDYPGEVKIILTPEPSTVGDGEVHAAQLALNDSQYDPERRDLLALNLEDIARLGRVAQALIDGREPNSRNYDQAQEVGATK